MLGKITYMQNKSNELMIKDLVCLNKYPKFVCKVVDLCTTQSQIMKIVWNIPLTEVGDSYKD